MSEQEPQRQYQTGDVVNGFVWTGTQWLPYQPPKNPWYNIGTWPIVLIAVLVGLMLLLAGGVFDDIASMFG
jgi:hypothetical protein